MDQLDYIFDTQLLLEGNNMPIDEIRDYISANLNGDCLLVVGDEEMIKLHFHTNKPWEVLQYVTQFGELFDVIVENMDRQQRGLKG
jgi:dihydroxyacetone kinase-like predicted kinase